MFWDQTPYHRREPATFVPQQSTAPWPGQRTYRSDSDRIGNPADNGGAAFRSSPIFRAHEGVISPTFHGPTASRAHTLPNEPTATDVAVLIEPTATGVVLHAPNGKRESAPEVPFPKGMHTSNTGRRCREQRKFLRRR